jgi:Ca2+-binding RTX toxin-like protein
VTIAVRRSGDDALYGGRDADSLFSDGADTLRGQDGGDTLGGNDDDALEHRARQSERRRWQRRSGWRRPDVLHGDAGADTLYGDAGRDDPMQGMAATR